MMSWLQSHAQYCPSVILLLAVYSMLIATAAMLFLITSSSLPVLWPLLLPYVALNAAMVWPAICVTAVWSVYTAATTWPVATAAAAAWPTWLTSSHHYYYPLAWPPLTNHYPLALPLLPLFSLMWPTNPPYSLLLCGLPCLSLSVTMWPTCYTLSVACVALPSLLLSTTVWPAHPSPPPTSLARLPPHGPPPPAIATSGIRKTQSCLVVLRCTYFVYC
jgi:hypothetical protein